MANEIKIIDPFSSYEMVSQVEAQGNKGSDFLDSVKSLQVGFGSKVLRVDRDGLWLGAETFASAPFSVDMDGNLIATSLNLSGFLEVGEALDDIGSGNITGTYIADGTIDTDKLNANAINGMTITGALIRTSTGGDRVELDGNSDSLKIYDSGELRIELIEDRMTFFDDSDNAIASLYASPSGNFLIAATNGNNVFISSSDDIVLSAGDDLLISAVDNLDIYSRDKIDIDTENLADDIYLGLGGNTFMQFGDGRVYLDTYIDMNTEDIVDAGDITCSSLTETSDIRLKKNISPLQYGLKELLKLKPIQYQFKKRKKKVNQERRAKKTLKTNNNTLVEKMNEKHLGFSAQDVYKIMPELTKNADGVSEETARLYPTQIIPVLVKAIQELSAEVQELKKK
jgi:hypothetical protein